jgi:hypothetical protein
MHFLDSWTELPLHALARLMLPAAMLAASMLLPGRRIARLTAALVAIAVLFLDELGLPLALRVPWAVLWAIVAWRAGVAPSPRPGVAAWRPGGVESGAVGLLLALALLALLVAAVARQDLSPDFSRRASYGLLLMCLGLLHLMLRRDVMRATVGFASLGIGLQVLERAARSTLLPESAPNPALVLLSTAIVVGLTARLAHVRERDAGSSWVSEAHDLHD